MGEDVTINTPTGTNTANSPEFDNGTVTVWSLTEYGWQTTRLSEGDDMSVFDENGNHVVKIEVDE